MTAPVASRGGRARVSVLIPCYNCARWVHRSIESALAQTYPLDEIVVLDDGSTDGSIDIIRRYDGRVAIERQANAGQNRARQHLAEISRGEWLVFLDADDELAPDSVGNKIAAADGADAIYGSMEIACFVGKQKTRFSLSEAVDCDDFFVAAFGWRFPNTSAFMFRKRALLDVGGWTPTIRNCTDYDLYFRMLLAGMRFRRAPAAHSLYRQWSVTQAVYEDALRRSRTRLQIVWSAARTLRERGEFDGCRRAAFYQTAFADLRTIARIDLGEASALLERIARWDPAVAPVGHSLAYRTAFRLAGFEAAERIAAAARPFRFVRPAETGVDPRSGLIYT